MVKRIGRSRRKTRCIFKKNHKDQGKISIRRYMKEFNLDDKVVLKSEPAVQKGGYFHRFHGKIGVICGKQGMCYKVRITDLGKNKELIVHPVHLKEV